MDIRRFCSRKRAASTTEGEGSSHPAPKSQAVHISEPELVDFNAILDIFKQTSESHFKNLSLKHCTYKINNQYSEHFKWGELNFRRGGIPGAPTF